MDNQQAKPSDYEMGWLAGFIDGEGCFSFSHWKKRKGGNEYAVRFMLGNTHVPSLDRTTNILDRLGLAYHVRWFDRKSPRVDGSPRKRLWYISIVGYKRMYRWLVIITPLLYTKRRQAEMLLDFVNLRLNNAQSRRVLSSAEAKLVPDLLRMNR
mgnify:CR=1 FL=1